MPESISIERLRWWATLESPATRTAAVPQSHLLALIEAVEAAKEHLAEEDYDRSYLRLESALDRFDFGSS